MLTSEATVTVAAGQSHHAASTVDEPGAAMLLVVGGILSRGTYDCDDVETLRSIFGDDGIDAGDRRFARSVMRWLAEQSTTRAAAIWQRNSDAWH